MARITVVMFMAAMTLASSTDQGSSLLAKDSVTSRRAQPLEQKVATLKDMDAQVEALKAKLSTPGAVPPPPVAAAAAPGPAAGTPEHMAELSNVMTAGKIQQQALSVRMDSAQKSALAVAKFQARKSIAADQAEEAHIYASDMLGEASDRSTEAAEARDAANKAVAAMQKAKSLLETKQAQEYNARVQASDQKKNEKHAQVDFETMSMKAERLKAAAAAADQEASDAREDKAACDEQQSDAEKTKAAAIEKLTRLQAAYEEKKNNWQYLEAQAEKAVNDANKASEEETTLTATLGAKSAASAKADVEEATAVKNRELASKNYHQLQTEAHSLDVIATQAEAKAKAAAAEARAMASSAKKDADAVVAQ